MKNGKKNEEIRLHQLTSLKNFLISKTSQDTFPTILLGDFNVNGFHEEEDLAKDSPEYQSMVNMLQEALQPKDLMDVLKETKKCHPPTVGTYEIVDGKKIPKEVKMTNKHDQCIPKRLDYIFWIHDKESQKSYELDCDVFPFFVEGTKVTQLSDHYALGLQVLCNGNTITNKQ